MTKKEEARKLQIEIMNEITELLTAIEQNRETKQVLAYVTSYAEKLDRLTNLVQD